MTFFFGQEKCYSKDRKWAYLKTEEKWKLSIFSSRYHPSIQSDSIHVWLKFHFPFFGLSGLCKWCFSFSGMLVPVCGMFQVSHHPICCFEIYFRKKTYIWFIHEIDLYVLILARMEMWARETSLRICGWTIFPFEFDNSTLYILHWLFTNKFYSKR